MQRCPISHNACTMHSDCLFLRAGGCAIVLAPQIAEENSKQIKKLSKKLDAIDYNLQVIASQLT